MQMTEDEDVFARDDRRTGARKLSARLYISCRKTLTQSDLCLA
jgi:hypothetical protein